MTAPKLTPGQRRPRWCVRWTRPKPGGWCATLGGRKPTADAWADDTACGMQVIMRAGNEKREPSCAACLAAIERAAGLAFARACGVPTGDET